MFSSHSFKDHFEIGRVVSTEKSGETGENLALRMSIYRTASVCEFVQVTNNHQLYPVVSRRMDHIWVWSIVQRVL